MDLEAQDGGDVLVGAEVGAFTQQHDLGVLGQGAVDRVGQHVLPFAGRRPVGGARGRARDGEEPAPGAHDPGGAGALVEQERLDALLGERQQGVGHPGRRAAVVAAGQALLESREEPVLALARDAVEDLGGGRPDLVGGRVLDVDGDVAGDPAAQVGRQRRLGGVQRLLRRAQDEAGGATRAQQAGGGLRDGLEVLVDVVLDGALVARLRPAALVVAAVDLALDERELGECVARRPPAGARRTG